MKDSRLTAASVALVCGLAFGSTAEAAQLADEPSAVWWTLPSSVEVGEPFRWLIEVRCPTGTLGQLEEQLALFAEGLDPSWALLSPEPLASSPDAAPGWSRYRAGWTAVSLEPGSRELPSIELQLAEGSAVATEPTTLEVRGVLAAGEDAPRPAADLRAPPAERSGLERSTLLGVAGGVLVALLAMLWLRRRRAREDSDEPSERDLLRQRLAALDEGPPDDPAAVAELYYELSALVRGALDERAGLDRRGATDPEWVAAVRAAGELPAEAAGELERFFERGDQVKYAAERPTRWAVEEDLQRLRAVLAAQPAVTAESVRSLRGESAAAEVHS